MHCVVHCVSTFKITSRYVFCEVRIDVVCQCILHRYVNRVSHFSCACVQVMSLYIETEDAIEEVEKKFRCMDWEVSVSLTHSLTHSLSHFSLTIQST